MEEKGKGKNEKGKKNGKEEERKKGKVGILLLVDIQWMTEIIR